LSDLVMKYAAVSANQDTNW